MDLLDQAIRRIDNQRASAQQLLDTIKYTGPHTLAGPYTLHDIVSQIAQQHLSLTYLMSFLANALRMVQTGEPFPPAKDEA